MRKICVILGALVVSVNCYANSTSLGADLKSAIQNNAATQSTAGGKNLSIIYGGQDISRHEIASANESLWTGQPTSIG